MHHKKTKTGRRNSQQWTEAEARAALRDFANSGLSTSAFARTRGISPQRLAYWRKRFAEAGPVAFVAVSLASATRAPSGTERAHIEIAYHDDVVLRVREDIDVEQLARIALALARVRGC